MKIYRNERNGTVAELADDHAIELGPHWVEVPDGAAPSKRRVKTKTE